MDAVSWVTSNKYVHVSKGKAKMVEAVVEVLNNNPEGRPSTRSTGVRCIRKILIRSAVLKTVMSLDILKCFKESSC